MQEKVQTATQVMIDKLAFQNKAEASQIKLNEMPKIPYGLQAHSGQPLDHASMI